LRLTAAFCAPPAFPFSQLQIDEFASAEKKLMTPERGEERRSRENQLSVLTRNVLSEVGAEVSKRKLQVHATVGSQRKKLMNKSFGGWLMKLWNQQQALSEKLSLLAP
jgi:hypothetical protein